MITRFSRFMKGYFPFIILACLLFAQACSTGTRDQVTFDLSDPRFPLINIGTNSKTALDEKPVALFLVNADSSQKPVLLETLQTDTGLTFKPVYPLNRSNMYRIHVKWQGSEWNKDILPVSQTGSLHEKVAFSVYPVSSTVPKNILQFHITFSEPMVKDVLAYEKLAVIDSKGNVLPHMWREKSEWNEHGTHLELMLHPGRVKHGITYLGSDQPLFEPGETYHLTIVDPLYTRSGSTLNEQTIKTFSVVAEDHKLPDVVKYGFDSSNRLYITFSEAMDFGTVQYGLGVSDANGPRLDARRLPFETGNDSTWVLARHMEQTGLNNAQLIIGTIVSDLAANRFSRPFEVTNSDSIGSEEARGLPLPQ